MSKGSQQVSDFDFKFKDDISFGITIKIIIQHRKKSYRI